MAVTLNPVSEVRTFTTSSGRTVYVLNGQSGFDLDALVAACHSAACRPPKSGGTGGSSDGGKLPPFFAKDADGYQFVGLHFTDSKEFKLGSKTPQGPYASGTRGEIFTTFDPRQPLNNSRDVATRPFAVEIWAKSKVEGYDYREDVGYEGNQITLNTKRESVRVGKVHQTKDIEAELEKVAQAQWSDDPDALDKVYGISWDKSGNEQTYESRTASGAVVAACHDASCRPPTSGGTGGSNSSSNNAREATNAFDAMKKSQALLKEMSNRSESAAAAGAVDRYIGMGYEQVNGLLRQQRGRPGMPKDRTVELLDQAFAEGSVSLSHPETLHRGLSFKEEGSTHEKIVEHLRKKFAVGEEFTDHAFVSTTFDENVAGDFSSGSGTNVRLTIKAGEGTRVLATSGTGWKESELILNRGTTMKVTSFTEKEDGLILVEVEVV